MSPSPSPFPNARPIGLPPGFLAYTGRRPGKPYAITVTRIADDGITEASLDLAALPSAEREGGVLWMDIDGLGDVEVLRIVGEKFGIHPLSLEDVLAFDHPPKMEVFETYTFLLAKMLTFDHAAMRFSFEQVGLALGTDFLLTFQDNPDIDVLEALRARLRSGRGLPHKMDAAHICHAALDAVADSYLAAADLIDDAVIELGNAVSSAYGPDTVQRIYHLQRELLRLRKWVLPFRDMVAQLMRRRSAHFPESMSVYLSDVHDHVCQTLDALDLNLELLSGQLSLAVSLENNRMSEVMKVLTIFTALFMPVTFIAGVYGMNFAHMPEINQPWGYPAVLCLMAGAILLMLRFFRKKRWL